MYSRLSDKHKYVDNITNIKTSIKICNYGKCARKIYSVNKNSERFILFNSIILTLNCTVIDGIRSLSAKTCKLKVPESQSEMVLLVHHNACWKITKVLLQGSDVSIKSSLKNHKNRKEMYKKSLSEVSRRRKIKHLWSITLKKSVESLSFS